MAPAIGTTSTRWLSKIKRYNNNMVITRRSGPEGYVFSIDIAKSTPDAEKENTVTDTTVLKLTVLGEDKQSAENSMRNLLTDAIETLDSIIVRE